MSGRAEGPGDEPPERTPLEPVEGAPEEPMGGTRREGTEGAPQEPSEGASPEPLEAAPAVTAQERLRSLRARIAAADEALVDLLADRLALARAIGEVKRELGLPVLDPAREAEVVRRAAERARDRGVDPELVRDVVWRIMAQARGAQR